jgi:hypothetical protein
MLGILAAETRCSLHAETSVICWPILTVHACMIALGRLWITATLKSHLSHRTVQLAMTEILAEQE